MKKNIIIGGVIILILLSFQFKIDDNIKELYKEDFIDFFKNNPERSALIIIRNDSLLAVQNPNKKMPLASTVKIILAIEYAEQSSKGILNPEKLIPIKDLEKFHVPNTDGGAHSSWLISVEPEISQNHISIREIAKGMIKYSSNANTEWLLNELGPDKVNKRLDNLELKNHSKIYNIVSALFVGKELFPNLKGNELENQLLTLSMEEYIETTHKIHQKLLSDTLYKNEIGDLSLDIQKIWSDRLPSSTAEDYVSIMKKINSRSYFDENTQHHLDDVMEFILENPANREWLEHSGMKGGSTPFVLTKALYATDKKGNKTELVYFLNDLNIFEMASLRISMNDFEYQILTDQKYREKVKNKFVK